MLVCGCVGVCACVCGLRCVGAGAKTLRLTGESCNKSTSSFIFQQAGFGLGMYIYARTTTTRIRQDADQEHKKQDPKPRRQTNLYILVYRFSFLCLHVCRHVSASICISMCVSVSIHGVPTRVHSHLTVISCTPETSGSRSCDSDSNGISQICLGSLFNLSGSAYFKILDTEHTHARRHVHKYTMHQ